MVKHRRPLAGFAVVLLFCLVLGVVGLGVEEKLEPLSLKVPGTAAAAGESLAQSHFGESSPFVVLLRGPAAAVDRQGTGPGPDAAARPERDRDLALGSWRLGGVASRPAQGAGFGRLPRTA